MTMYFLGNEGVLLQGLTALSLWSAYFVSNLPSTFCDTIKVNLSNFYTEKSKKKVWLYVGFVFYLLTNLKERHHYLSLIN